MEVICLENEAFYALIEEIVQRLKEKNNIIEDKWISGEEALPGKVKYTKLHFRISCIRTDEILNALTHC
ncbi:MAG: hypothetical protein IPG01_13170 [Chitinophagaceae bacterium]|nr:hypothetical protein [Chitinophagaceae bacterium]